MRFPWQRHKPVVAAVEPTLGVGAQQISSTIQSWQERSRFFAKNLGLVSFALEIASMGGSRVDWVIQQLQGDGSWATVEDSALTGVLSWYRNDWQSPRELLQAHLWRVGCDGDRFEVMHERSDGSAGYFVVPQPRVLWKGEAQASVYLSPNATVNDGTLLEVDRAQVTRMWTPDQDWPFLGVSPMKGVIEDCERYWSLIRYQRRTANSRLAMSGMVWTPQEAHEPMPPQIVNGESIQDPRSKLDVQMSQAAQAAFTDDSSMAAFLPMVMRYANDLKPPQLIDFSKSLSKDFLDAADKAAKQIAIGLPLPATMLLGENANHWNEWLTDERSFRWAMAPQVERVANDLTQSFLRPVLKVMVGQGQAKLDPAAFRIWYDPTAVIIHPDQTAHALELHLAGLLGDIPTLEVYGFGAEDAMNVDERAALIDLLHAQHRVPPGAADVATSPGSVVERPPNGAQIPIAASAGPVPLPLEVIDWYRKRG